MSVVRQTPHEDATSTLPTSTLQHQKRISHRILILLIQATTPRSDFWLCPIHPERRESPGRRSGTLMPCMHSQNSMSHQWQTLYTRMSFHSLSCSHKHKETNSLSQTMHINFSPSLNNSPSIRIHFSFTSYSLHNHFTLTSKRGYINYNLWFPFHRFFWQTINMHTYLYMLYNESRCRWLACWSRGMILA